MYNEKFFLALSFLAFLAIIIKLLAPKLSKSLDETSKKVAEEILAAKEMKEKAVKLLASAEKYYTESTSYADKLLKDAETEAEKFLAEAQKSISEELDKKTAAAQNRIKFAEENAIQDIKNSIITAALNTVEVESEAGLDKKHSDYILSQATNSFGTAL
jgi:F-type H+-transporting ATPase subunit b